MKDFIFKPSLILKAKQKYKGDKKNITLLLVIYSMLVETTYNNQHIHFISDIIPFFDKVILDLKKHIDLETHEVNLLRNRVVDLIESMERLQSNFSNISTESVFRLHSQPVYLYTVADLRDLLQKVFDSLGIQTKIVKVKSKERGILVPTFITDLTPTEQFIEEQIALSSAIKEKIFAKFKESLKKQDVVLQDLSDGTYALTKYSNPIAYINESIPDPKTTFKIFTNKSEIETFLQKKQLIDEAYDKLTLGEEGKLYTPKGELVTTIDFIPKQKIQASIKKYNTLIDQHNSTLQPYETKLNNEPKTVQLGDHSLKIVKVIDKNVVRPIIIEGPYTGVFLDQLVSSEGKVLGSKSVASPYFMENKQVLESMGGGRLRVKDIFKMEQSVVSNIIKDYVPNRDPLDINVQVITYGLRSRDSSYSKVRYISTPIKKMSSKIKIDPSQLSHLFGLSIVGDIETENETFMLSLNQNSFTKEVFVRTYYRKKNYAEFDLVSLDRTLSFNSLGKPLEIHNELFIAPACAPDGLGLRVFTQQVKAAVESKFPIITTFAARSEGFFVGYYVWPKLGYGGKIPDIARFFEKNYKERFEETSEFEDYDTDNLEEIDESYKRFDGIHPKAVPLFKWLDERNLLNKKKISGKYLYEADILDIYAYKVGDRFIGQELWKEFGDGVDLTFDLSEGSLSRRILDSYVTLKAQKDGLPVQDYLNVDYGKYTKQKSLTCLITDKIMKKRNDGSYSDTTTNQFSSDTKEALRVAIKNAENGELLEILNRKDAIEILERLYEFNILTDSMLVEVKEIIRDYEIKLPSRSDTLKLASNTNKPNKKPKQNDAVFRGLDMGILDKIWDEISKLYG